MFIVFLLLFNSLTLYIGFNFMLKSCENCIDIKRMMKLRIRDVTDVAKIKSNLINETL